MPTVTEERWGSDRDGAPISVFTLAHPRGTRVTLTNHGATVLSLEVPDRRGAPGDVTLGFATLAEYLLGNRPYFGAVVGRYANRIARGDLPVEGTTHALACNDGQHHLHGGRRGFDQVTWAATPVTGPDRAGVTFRHLSRHGEEGYPGDLAAEVTCSLTARDELCLDYRATTTRATVCNLSHHGYFNLDAGLSPDVLGHVLTIDAERFTPVGPGLIPTGELRPVAGTPMDFRRPSSIGARLGAADEQLALAGGYDHNWALNRPRPGLALAARVLGPLSGRVLEVLTTEPGLQFYSGNFLDGTIVGKGGVAYGRHAGLCLETQHFPDSPHHPEFPSTLLRPGETYRSSTVYRFSAG
jgi:aldose 1-epimerase